MITAVLVRAKPDDPIVTTIPTGLELRANGISFLTSEMELVASKLTCNIGIIKSWADRIDHSVELMTSTLGSAFVRAKRVLRRVDEIDETSAGHIKLDSTSLLELNGEVTAISGESLVKVQSEQIHMG